MIIDEWNNNNIKLWGLHIKFIFSIGDSLNTSNMQFLGSKYSSERFNFSITGVC